MTDVYDNIRRASYILSLSSTKASVYNINSLICKRKIRIQLAI